MTIEIFPLVGLGPIRLGMSPEEVASHNDLIGGVESRIVDEDPSDAVLDALDRYADPLPKLFAPMQDTESSAKASFSEFGRTTSPILRYREFRLVEIVLNEECATVHLRNLRLFDLPRQSALRQLTLMGGPRRSLRGVYLFESLGMLLHGFSTSGERIINLIDAAAAAQEAALFPLDP